MNHQTVASPDLEVPAAEQGGAPAVSRRARSMQASPLRKLAATAEARKKKGIKVYHLNIGQPDLPTPATVFEEIRSLNLKTIAYAPSNGMPTAVAAWKRYLNDSGVDIAEDELIVTSGGSEAIIFALAAICDPEDEIVVFEPFYTNYNGFATLANVQLRAVGLSIENGFHLPPTDIIEKQITKRTRGILICSPANPTGTIYSREEVQRLVDIVRRHHLFLLADEVYREFAYDAPFTSIMSFPEIREQAILLDSTSKRFNVCGARVGVIASHNKDVIQAAFRFAMARLSVATIEQLALVPLLNASRQFTDPIVAEFRKRRDVVYESLRKIPGVTIYKPEGALYIMVGLPIRDAERFAKWLIEEYEDAGETVLLAPAQGFYATPGKGLNEVRLACMLSSDQLKRSVEIIGRALEVYRKTVEA